MQHLRWEVRSSLPVDRHLRRQKKLQIFFHIHYQPFLTLLHYLYRNCHHPIKTQHRKWTRILHCQHLTRYLRVSRHGFRWTALRLSHLPLSQKHYHQLILQRCLGRHLRQSLLQVIHQLFRSSFGKNILKIFGRSDPLLVDPETVMINRGDLLGSDKNTENA